ncbi:hypothetical protein [Streptomyces clavuligerus]|uniref:Uncharacterized protein n=1 Tax=Streptomyces clavuligerus TaxID=1901 RepID=D5SJ15_STRCL|nr:hypothetical protein [Streptomyces clavuligerus]EFG03908.1 Hypothetical protein SCLAV_p0418 [Streptomyces clavuligerus]MBY6307587.1 hypothetical protein [Streptomyces clavuligerus]QCS09862.1 hypothetical protein CRV15_30130 [Streptomyces clavuligerus]QPJ98093.1 hypothetical protein GE265_34300 [Streptomyces clavuligerus]WDN56564.1 hypothetical protein LL058_32585 [Streptomyces clavuligerus]
MTDSTDPPIHPVRAIFRRAATTYNAHLVESDDFCVLLATGNATTDLTAVILPGTTLLSVSGITWSEYDWEPGDENELAQLEEDIAAVQRGDGALYFRARDGELEYTGGRIGHRGINPPFNPDKALHRTFTPWEQRPA